MNSILLGEVETDPEEAPRSTKQRVPQKIREIIVDIGSFISIHDKPGIYILSKLKNREEFEGGLEERKGKGEEKEKKKRVIKHMLKYLYEA